MPAWLGNNAHPGAADPNSVGGFFVPRADLGATVPPMENRKLKIIALFIALVLFLAMTLPAFAFSDEGQPVRTDPALVLARTLLAEAGHRKISDHPAILHVLQKRADRAGISIARMSAAYSTPLRSNRTPTTPNARLARAASWRYLDANAPDIAQLARAWDHGEREADPCHGRAWHFGNEHDASSRFPPDARVDCGPTRNVFLTEPRRRR